jgi:hypothetical protein
MDGGAPNKKNVEMDAYSVEEFCRRHSISRSTYYVMQSEGTGPDECRVKNRVLVTAEAAQEFRDRNTKRKPPKPDDD